jgi:hypothetical protein
MTHGTPWIATAALALALAACGGGISTDLEGIYEIDTWTSNSAGCETEGTSVLASQSQQRFYLRSESYFGADFLNVALCTTDTACATEAATGGIEFDGWAFEDGSDGAGWRGTFTAATVTGGECQGPVSDDVLRSPADGMLRIESRFRESRTFAPDGDGFCNSDDAIAAAAGEPCVRFDVVTATFAAPLP